MADTKTPITVTIAIVVNGEVKTFETEATAFGDPYDVASGLLNGLDTEAGRWLYKAGTEARRGY